MRLWWILWGIFSLCNFSVLGQAVRPTITIPDRNLMYMDVNDNLILKDGAKELLAAIANNKEMDVIVWNDSFYSNRVRADAIKYEDIIKELKEEIKSDSFKDWNEISRSEQSKLRYSGTLGHLSSSEPKLALLELADRYHNRGNSIKPNDWNSTRSFSEPEVVLFSSLGEKLLEEGFSFDNSVIKMSYKEIDGEIKCELKLEEMVEVGNVDICRNSIGWLTKWIKEEERVCGEFTLDGKHLLAKVNYLKCMPPQFKSYVEHRTAELTTVCADVDRCLSTIIGDEGEKLTNDFISLIDSFNIPEKNTEVFKNPEEDYREIVSGMKGELLEFKEACQPQYINFRFNEIANQNSESKEFFEEKFSSFNETLSEVFDIKLSPDEFDDMKLGVEADYKKCVVKSADYYRSRGSLGERYGKCEGELLADALKGYIKILFPEKNVVDILDQFTEVERSVCLPESNYLNQPKLRNFSYDLKRCSKIVEDKHKYGDAFKLLTERKDYIDIIDKGSERSLVYGYREREDEESELNEGLRGALFECIDKNETAPQRESCFEESIKRESSKIFVERIAMDQEVLAKVRLTEAHRNSLTNRLYQSDDFSACLDKLGDKKETFNNCDKIAKQFVLAAVGDGPPSFFNGPYQEARRGLLADFEDKVRVLPHDTSTFHWVESELIGHDRDEPLSLRSTRSYTYALGREYVFHAGPFMNKIIGEPVGATQAGRGLYTSTDPNATSDYGDVLLEIRLPEGAKYLDTSDSSGETGFDVSKYTYEKLIEAGCDLDGEKYNAERRENRRSGNQNWVESSNGGGNVHVHRRSDESYATIRKTVFEVDKVCHQVFSSVVSELDVKFFSYPYGSQKPSFCDSYTGERSRRDNGRAFVMIDAPLRGNIRTYNRATIEKAIKDFEEKSKPIPEDIKRLLGIYQFRSSHRQSQQGDSYSDQEILEYWKKRIYDCDLLQDEQ